MHYKPIPLKDLTQSKDLATYCFVTQPGTDRHKELTHLIDKGAGVGGYIGNKLISQLYAIPFEMNVFGVKMGMGGIATVSTYPEYREGGHTKQLLLRSLEMMREKGQLLSVLSPFTESFYRYFGWEVFFENSRYTIPAELLKMRQPEKGQVIRFAASESNSLHEKVKQFHDQIVVSRNGLTYRDSDWWERLHTRNPGTFYAVCLDEKDQLQGYLRYRIEKQEFKVLDLYAQNAKSERILWNFIAAHSSQIEKVTGTAPVRESFAFHFSDPDFERKIYFEMMIRIVDVERFLAAYPFKELRKPLYVTIRDEHASWNNQTFKVEANGVVTKPKLVAEEKVLSMDISVFSAMMMGYHNLEWYQYNGYATVSEQVKQDWIKALPSAYPVFNDHF